MDKLYDLLNIPKQSRLKNRIALNQIYKASNLTIKEQKDFSKNVDKIYLISEINSNNCNYLPVIDEDIRYETIQFIYIHLFNPDGVEQVDDIIHKLFPNPIIIIYDYEDKYCFSSAIKRINKVDKSKAVIADIYNSTFNVKDNFYKIITDIFNNRNIKTIYELYKQIDDSIYYQMLFQITNKFEYSLDIGVIKEKYKKIEELEKVNRQLKLIYNSEKNKAKQMDLFMKIKINEECIKKIIDEIEV